MAKYNDESEARSNEIIAELNLTLGIAVDTAVSSGGGGFGGTGTGTLGRDDPVAETIVRLAESNGDIFFKDTFGQPYAIINIGNHIEVVSMESIWAYAHSSLEPRLNIWLLLIET